MNSLEPILAQKANLSRAACPPKGGRAPTRKPFAYFFVISPAVIFLEKVKGVLVGSPTASGGGGAALVGKSDALRALVLQVMRQKTN